MSDLVIDLYNYIAEKHPEWGDDVVEQYVLDNIDEVHMEYTKELTK